jgi:cobalt-zinc-cadmium efflux system outer membrane protein
MNIVRFLRQNCGAAGLALGLGAFAGCAHYEARPLVPEHTAAAFSARSLQDEGLHRFLTQNLGRELPAWPLPSWDFETLTWVAFYYQPSLEVARAQWDVARSGIQTAAARPNPTLTVTPGYDTNSSGSSPWFPGINVDFLLETARKRGYRTAIEQANAEEARLNVLASAWQVRSELRRDLLDLAAAERKAALLRQQAALQRELMTLLEQRFNAGAIASFEVSVARTALVKAEAASADAERQAPLARNRVAEVLGVPLAALEGVKSDDLLAVPGPVLAPADLAAARRQSLQSRADVLGALAHYEASQAALQLEVAKQYPDFHLGPGYQYDLGENKWSLAVALELPLFNRNQGPIGEAGARRRQAAAEFTVAQARAIAEIDGAAAAQSAAAAQLVHLRQLRAELQKQAALVQAHLDAGDADRVELQNVRIDLAGSDATFLDAEAGAALAAGQLEDALQVPFHNLSAVVVAPRDTAPLSRTP